MVKAGWASLDGFTPAQAHLSPEERARSERLHQAGRRRQYEAGHALLKRLAADLLGIDPAEVILTAKGKPAFPGAARKVWLSLSHSGTFVAAAVSDEGPLGIDIEVMDQSRDWAAMAARLGWEGPETRSKAGFLKAWTLKEAEFKAGLGPVPGGAQIISLPEFQLALVTSRDTAVDWVR